MNFAGEEIKKTTKEANSKFSEDLNKLVSLYHTAAREKGWWDNPRTDYSIHALFLSEISEAVEELRKPAFPEVNSHKGNALYYNDPESGKAIAGVHVDKETKIPLYKPEGVAVEMADFVIRGLDYFGYMEWEVKQVSDKQLGTFLAQSGLELVPEFFKELNAMQIISETICEARRRKGKGGEILLSIAFALCEKYVRTEYDMDFLDVIKLKGDFNTKRSKRHGGKKY